MQMPDTEGRQNTLPGVTSIVAVSSGKGGVGKSTVSVNLAVALANAGNRVGLLDADIYGPNVPGMLGVHQEPVVEDGKIHPPEAFGVKMMSLGLVAGEDTPIIWRGPIVGKIIQQFLVDVLWGDLDQLIVDLPPGTGDAQLTLSQSVPLSGAVIVTTPQDVALEDVTRSVSMFNTVDVPVLGVVENMSHFVCPCCGDRVPLFGEGGGERIAARFDIPLLSQIPLLPEICAGGDSGSPIAASESPQAEAFSELAARVKARIQELGDDLPEISIS
jgi:ATP-binding protein involved in chromosome partitioning